MKQRPDLYALASGVASPAEFAEFVRTFAKEWERRHLDEDSPDEAPLQTVAAGNITVGQLFGRLNDGIDPDKLPLQPTWALVAQMLIGRISSHA